MFEHFALEYFLLSPSGTPDDINTEKLRYDLEQMPEVLEVHELHVWSVSVFANCLF